MRSLWCWGVACATVAWHLAASAEGAAQEPAAPAAPVLRGVLLLGDALLPAEQVKPGWQALLGQPMDAERLERLRQAVAQVHDQAGWGLVSVDTPRMQGGTAVVRLTALRLGRRTVVEGDGASQDGSTWFDAMLPALRTGEPPPLNAVDAQLRLAQLQPSRSWALDFRAAVPAADGQATRVPRAPTVVDAELRASELRPWWARVGLDNAGQAATGRERMRLQVGLADALGPGRSIDLAVMTSVTRPSRQRQVALRYQHPVPEWATLLSAEATHAYSEPGVVSEFFDVSGRSHGWSLAGRRLLPRIGGFEPHIELSYEPSLHRDVIDFFGSNLGYDVGLAPVVLGVGGAWQGDFSRAEGQLRWRHNEGWGTAAGSVDYELARAGAKPRWDVIEATLNVGATLARGRQASLRLQAQWASGPLVSPVQFRVGGSQLLRGLQESELGGDAGVVVALEHAWSLTDAHQLFALLDAGKAWRQQALAGEASWQGAASLGVGWRWQFLPRWQLQATWARVTWARDLGVTERGDSRLHLALDGAF